MNEMLRYFAENIIYFVGLCLNIHFSFANTDLEEVLTSFQAGTRDLNNILNEMYHLDDGNHDFSWKMT